MITKFKNMKIGKRLLTTFIIVLILFTICIGTAMVNLRIMAGNTGEFYQGPFTATDSTWSIKNSLVSLERYLYKAMASPDLVLTKQYVDAARKEVEAIDKTYNDLIKKFSGDTTNLEAFHEGIQKTYKFRDQIFELALVNSNEEAMKIMDEDYLPLSQAATDYLTNEITLAEAQSKEFISTALTNEIITYVVLAVIAAVSVIFIIYVALLITKSITVPVKEMKDAVERVAAGDLEVVVKYKSEDELGVLSESVKMLVSNLKGIIEDQDYVLNEMAAGNFSVSSKNEASYKGEFESILNAMKNILNRLNDTLTQINYSSDSVAEGSDNIAQGAQSLSQGATDQAGTVQELLATVNEVSDKIVRNAQDASDVSGQAADIGKEMIHSNDQMKKMLAAMEEISKSSQQISNIIRTIEDIAEQTNLLALNASIEAARAGEAGRGFAVVANEVGSLAAQSAEASKSSTSLIEDSLKAVENGMEIAKATADTLVKAVEGVNNVSNSITRISEDASDQAESITQISMGVEQISNVVQSNSALAEESAASSEELSAQASVLKSLVSQFVLKA